MCIYISCLFGFLFLISSIISDDRLYLVNQLFLISGRLFFERLVRHHFFPMAMTGGDKMHVFTRKPRLIRNMELSANVEGMIFLGP